MSETDPFADSVFSIRLLKLIPMLGSEQPGEAEAARRKIGEHLASHRLSFTDLAQHLHGTGSRPPAPSFTQGARELSLERQLAIARTAKAEAAQEAEAALHRVRMLEVELQQATFEIGRTLNSQAQVRIAAAVACIVAAACLIFVVLPRAPAGNGSTSAAARNPVVVTAPPNGVGGSATHLGAGEVLGYAAVQDLAIRLSPNDQGAIRAFLNMGEPIVVQYPIRLGPQVWLRVRTPTGEGWVRSGDVQR